MCLEFAKYPDRCDWEWLFYELPDLFDPYWDAEWNAKRSTIIAANGVSDMRSLRFPIWIT